MVIFAIGKFTEFIYTPLLLLHKKFYVTLLERLHTDIGSVSRM